MAGNTWGINDPYEAIKKRNAEIIRSALPKFPNPLELTGLNLERDVTSLALRHAGINKSIANAIRPQLAQQIDMELNNTLSRFIQAAATAPTNKWASADLSAFSNALGTANLSGWFRPEALGVVVEALEKSGTEDEFDDLIEEDEFVSEADALSRAAVAPYMEMATSITPDQMRRAIMVLWIILWIAVVSAGSTFHPLIGAAAGNLMTPQGFEQLKRFFANDGEEEGED